jgi:alkaline phosphatase D
MVVEYATSESFRDARRVVGPAALETSGFTARVELLDLPPDARISYRVLFQDLGDSSVSSPPVPGRFRSAPTGRRDVLFAWSADTVGQGWGINPEWGGLRIYETMRLAVPDFFVHCGDSIYADQPLLPEVRLDDGTIWRNVVTAAKSKVAESLDEFRGNYLYNLLDENVRRFAAEVPQIALWDDHEVRDNWYETRSLLEDPRYTVKSMPLLAARARRAFLDHLPIRRNADEAERIYRSFSWGPSLELFALDMRSYRGPNSENRQRALDAASALIGPAQREWLKAGLAASRSTWKVVAIDLPIGLVVPDPPEPYFEAVANGDPGPPLGRELEIADLVKFIRDRRIRNVVFVTADVHYGAAHHYHPARARFAEFDPFWEFVAGPAHAGTFGPNPLDPTFGPEAKFIGIPPGMKPNRPPSAGLQFFGTIKVDARTQAATVKLHNLAGEAIYTVELPAGA